MTSQINPNNIDGEYPVAGVSNNTQGMRDNFTNIKTNFQYAEDEITDLQSKGVFKAALTGTTLDNNMANNVIYNAQVRGMSGTVVAIAATSGTVNIDCNAGPYQTIAIAGNIILAFTAATWPPAGTFGMIRLRVTVDAAGRTMTLPVSVSQGTTAIQGLLSNVLTFATAGTFEFGFSTIDAGTTIVMYDFTRPLDYYTDTVTIANTAVSTNAGTGALIVAGGVGVSGNLYVTGDIVGNIVVAGSTFVGNVTAGNLLTGGLVSATGNVTGGNIATAGLVSATGNITGGNLLSATLSLSGNILSAINTTANVTTTANISGGNLLTGGFTSATGNVTGGNLRTTGQMSAAGNVTGGNVSTGGLITATGNITGGNILTGGLISATSTITSTANITGGNILTGGLISATGNITGGNVLGGANVNATLFTGTTVSVTGNVTGGNLITAALAQAATLSATGAVTFSGTTTNQSIGTSQTTGTLTMGGTSGTGIITVGRSTASQTTNIQSGATGTGNTKTINIGDGGLAGSTTTIAVGPVSATTAAGTVTFNTATVVAIANTSGTALSVAGNVTGSHLRTSGQLVAASGTAITAGGTQSLGLEFSTTADFGVFFGSGVPTISAAKGSLYLRSDGTTTNDRMYVNTNGATTWTAVITAA